MLKKTAGWEANSVDPDQMPQNAASDLGLHCLLRLVCPGAWINKVDTSKFKVPDSPNFFQPKILILSHFFIETDLTPTHENVYWLLIRITIIWHFNEYSQHNLCFMGSYIQTKKKKKNENNIYLDNSYTLGDM